MTYINPLKINALGEISQCQTGDAVAMKFGGAGQKFRGSVGLLSGTTIIPFDTTPPLITEGTQLWTQTITPQGIDSVIKITFDAQVDVNTANVLVTIAFFRGSTMIGCRSTSGSGANGLQNACLAATIYDTPGTVAATTYSCRIGASAAATWYLGQGTTQTMGGTNPSWWSITEEL